MKLLRYYLSTLLTEGGEPGRLSHDVPTALQGRISR